MFTSCAATSHYSDTVRGDDTLFHISPTAVLVHLQAV